jgi:hypothetical protein
LEPREEWSSVRRDAMSTYRNDDEILRALRERVSVRRRTESGPRVQPLPALAEQISRAEAKIRFSLPPLLRRVYEIANGGIGPGEGLLAIGDGEDTLVSLYSSFVDARGEAPKPGEPGFAQYPWPERLLPICDWGCAIWSCLDCRATDGPIVTASNGEPFANTGHTLQSWLSAWLDGVDLFAEMFEPGPTLPGINPFTRQPIVIKGQGKPRGTRWP